MSSEVANESSFDLRLRPTSDSPAARISIIGVSTSGTRLTGRARGAARRGELVQLGERRLVVRLAHQDRPQLVARLRVAGPLGQGERQVEARHEVVGVDLDRLAERVDRLVPVLL